MHFAMHICFNLFVSLLIGRCFLFICTFISAFNWQVPQVDQVDCQMHCIAKLFVVCLPLSLIDVVITVIVVAQLIALFAQKKISLLVDKFT